MKMKLETRGGGGGEAVGGRFGSVPNSDWKRESDETSLHEDERVRFLLSTSHRPPAHRRTSYMKYYLIKVLL